MIVDIWRLFGINFIIILIYSRFLCTAFVWKWPCGFGEDVKSLSYDEDKIHMSAYEMKNAKKKKKPQNIGKWYI